MRTNTQASARQECAFKGKTDSHHAGVVAGRGGCQQGGLQELNEQEVSDMIGAKLELKAVLGLSLWTCHDASIGDEDVQLLALAQEVGSTLSDRLQVVQLQLEDIDLPLAARVACSDLLCDILALLDIPGCGRSLLCSAVPIGSVEKRERYRGACGPRTWR